MSALTSKAPVETLAPLAPMQRPIRSAALLFAAALALLTATTPRALAENRTFALPSYQANPGATFDVPLSLDNAKGLAALSIQVNFDQTQLELLSVTPGPLGSQFQFSEGRDDGLVSILFARSENLTTTTTGTTNAAAPLAYLKFRAKPNLPVDTFTELAIANIALSDSEAVVDLLQIDSVAVLNGRITFSSSRSIDNLANGLPDPWEALYGLDPFASPLLDSDNDGLSNLLEYAYGSSPIVADAGARTPRVEAPTEINGRRYLTLSFVRRTDDTLLQYQLQESTNLLQWNTLSLSSQILGSPQSLGDNTERVTARGSIPMSADASSPRGYLRLRVQR